MDVWRFACRPMSFRFYVLIGLFFRQNIHVVLMQANEKEQRSYLYVECRFGHGLNYPFPD